MSRGNLRLAKIGEKGRKSIGIEEEATMDEIDRAIVNLEGAETGGATEKTRDKTWMEKNGRRREKPS